jgi:hypothetical protein
MVQKIDRNGCNPDLDAYERKLGEAGNAENLTPAQRDARAQKQAAPNQKQHDAAVARLARGR